MKYEKKVIATDMPKCYAIGMLDVGDERSFVVATEKEGPIRRFALDGTPRENVCDGPGGVMTVMQTPGRTDQLMATYKFFSPNFRLSHLAGRLTHQLSGGEKRLVALAATLAMQPRALLLDEPTNDLDATYQKKLIQILQKLPVGWIIISHDFNFLQKTCTAFMTIARQQLVRCNYSQMHQHFHSHPLGDTPHHHNE